MYNKNRQVDRIFNAALVVSIMHMASPYHATICHISRLYKGIKHNASLKFDRRFE